MAACLALLRAFEPTNEQPQQTVAAGAALAEQVLGEDAVAPLSTGQWAALVDHAIWQGEEAFAASPLIGWVQGGNYAKPVRYLGAMDPRGRAERDVWNLGADA